MSHHHYHDVPQYVKEVVERFQGVVTTPSGWKCLCPVPSHGGGKGDSSPSLRLTIGQNGKVLVNCRVGCSYKDVLLAAGLEEKELFAQDGDLPAKPLTVKPLEPSDAEAKHRDTVYRKLLQKLELSNEHRLGLLARGLSEFEIKESNYKSLSHSEAVGVPHAMWDEFGDSLYAVPGFVKGEDGKPKIPDHCVGLLIPVKKLGGTILAIKSRRKMDPKYMYLSSSDLNPGSPCHVPRTVGLKESPIIRLTEGELKAHVATYLSGVPTIGVGGVMGWKESLPVLASLKPKTVVVSMDWKDVSTNGDLCGETLYCAETLKELGYEVWLEEWDAQSHKGIDDVLKAGGQVLTSKGQDAFIRLTKIWKDLHGFEFTDAEKIPLAPSLEERNPVPFPVEVFPQAVRDYIEKVSFQLQTPPDWVAGGILVTAGRALGTTRSILLDDGYEEMGNLYAVVVGPPGTLKTASMRAAIHPLLRRQKRLNEVYKSQVASFKEYNQAKKEAKETGEPLPLKVDPPHPLEHVYTINITNEALVSRLASNGDIGRRDTSILIFSDELKAWISGMNQYRGGKGADKEFFLSGWSRTQYKGDRKGNEESVTIECPFVCVYGAIQPDVLPSIETQRGVEDGFIDRLLFLFPNATRSYRPPKDRPRPTKDKAEGELSPLELAKLQYDSIIFRLLLGCRHLPGGEPKTLEFTDAAWEKWKVWLDKHADETDSSRLSLRGVWSKLRAYAGRFALVLHMLRVSCEEAGALDEEKKEVVEDGLIDELDVENAIKLVDYFKAHYRDVSSQFAYGPEDRRALELAEWALTKENGVGFLDEVARKKLFGCRGKSDADKLARLAVDRSLGSLKTAKNPKTGKEGWVFQVDNQGLKKNKKGKVSP